MYQYKITNDLNDKAKSILTVKSNKSSKDIIDKLKEVNNSFTPNTETELPESPTFERMENIEIDNEKIKTDARNSLESYKNQSIKDINQDFKNQEVELKTNLKNVKQTANDAKESVANTYANLKEEASNDALKRGLARSSIVINTLDAFNNKELETYNQIDKELSNNINAINFELSALTSNYEDALNNFDIEYASKLNEKISEATEKLKEEQEKVIKYNNEIAEKEAEFNTKLFNLNEELKNKSWEQNLDVVDLYGKYGTLVVEKYKSNRMYDIALSYFSEMNKDDALNELTNNAQFKTLLGDTNYQKLIDTIKS